MQYYDKSFHGDLCIVLSFFVFPSLVWEVGHKSATMLELEYDIISTMQLTYQQYIVITRIHIKNVVL